jgi:dipeptidyl aminopeptidase/acylaminoacyl peptidase
MLEDHVAGIRQLAARDPAMDLERVGIFGSSGGGFTSTRAMLLHPDFFKAAVSFAGSHDLLRHDGPEWSDRYSGPFEQNREVYEKMSNTTFADRLTGKLLLVHGEADTEVTVSMTQQLVHALIAANRDFDLLYIPNAEHDLDSHPYAVRRRWDYFVRHLRNEEPPAQFRMPVKE